VGAGLDRLAIHVNGASAAVAGFATDVSTCEVEFFAQVMNQQGAWLNGFFFLFAIDGNRDEFFGHGCVSLI
jgi:hypothetical protein